MNLNLDELRPTTLAALAKAVSIIIETEDAIQPLSSHEKSELEALQREILNTLEIM